jgi:hypothetical protein
MNQLTANVFVELGLRGSNTGSSPRPTASS